MSDLLRWTEEGATVAESALLDASRAERAPAHARTRTLQALGVSTAVATTAVTATTAASAAPVASASAIGWGLAVKVAGLSIVAGGALVGALAVRAAHKPVAPPAASSFSVPVASAPAASAAPIPEEPSSPASATETGTENPTHTGVRARSRTPAGRPSGANDGLAREVVALEHAQQALAAHDPAAALRWLDQYRTEFPGGALASDATVLRVQALLTKGDRAAAKELADRYAKDHPDSPYAKRIEDLARGGTTP